MKAYKIVPESPLPSGRGRTAAALYRRWARNASAMALTLLLAAALPACSKNDTPTNPPYGGGGGGGGTPGAIPVSVVLKDFTITMPASLSAGLTDFRVTNGGATVHSFEIAGNGIDKSLPGTLAPGGSATLQVTLSAGTYHVLCPVDSHAAMGMSLDVTVK